MKLLHGPEAWRFARMMLTGSVMLVAVMVVATYFGPGELDFARAFDASIPQNSDRALLWHVRLPRVILGALCGMALGVVGASLQALLRNPLADPYVLGTSGGAAMGGTLIMLFGSASMRVVLLPVGAFLGALLATIVVYAIARGSDSLSIAGILLAGIVVNAFAAASITFVKILVSATQAHELLFWLVGSIGYETWPVLAVVTGYVVLGTVAMVLLTGRMNLLSLGDTAAAHLGVQLGRVKVMLFVASALVVGGVVAFCGMIGFVGLVVPHAVRLVIGADHRLVVPLSAFSGGAFLVAADLSARLLYFSLGSEAPVGAVTAMIGCPIFLYLLYKGNASAQATAL